ncbi:MAG: sulfate reduction electron transfer complex DsrMKJOP subunit DsrJ [Nitrospirae bacterium]|nr:sulfate reduction electron transfer complex DsrMKJOP subunit DsrJ [Nitrospirota bacterium]
MYNGGKIIAGLIIFVGLFTFPIFYNMGKTSAMPEPKLDTPVIKQLVEKRCVESKEYMRANHMQLLDNWRDLVIREGNLVYESTGGKKYIMSLQNTCMHCHSNKKEFCDKCHNYANVKPYCWSCHIPPKENEI